MNKAYKVLFVEDTIYKALEDSLFVFWIKRIINLVASLY